MENSAEGASDTAGAGASDTAGAPSEQSDDTWKTNPSHMTRSNTPTKRESKSKTWEYVRRMKQEHPMAAKGTHICTIQGCSDRVLNLGRNRNGVGWQTTAAVRHLRKYHADDEGANFVEAEKKQQVR